MKAKQSLKEMRELNSEKLQEKVAGLNRELLNLRFRHSAGQLQQTSSLKNTRRERARALTVLRQKAQQEA